MGALPPLAITLALTAWYLTPWPALNLGLAAVFSALAWRWPRWTVALAPLTFSFWFAPVHVTNQAVFPLSELALAIVTLVVLAKAVIRLPRWWPRAERIVRAYAQRTGAPVTIGAALLLAGLTIGVLIARQPHEALRAWRWDIAEPLVYAALVVWRLRGRWLWRTLWAFLASGATVAALAFAQATFAHITVAPLGAGGGLVPYPGWSGLQWRTTAIIYGSPNTAGAWMARVAPLALAVALWPRAARSTWRWLASLSAIALGAGLALTGSRGAWLGAAVGVTLVVVGGLAFTWRQPHLASAHHLLRWEGRGEQTAPGASASRRVARSLGWLVAGALCAALAYGTAALWLAPLVGLAGAAHGGSGEVRLLVWRAALAMGRDHPLFGVGPDQFLYYYDPRYTNHPYLIATLNGRRTAAASQPNLSHPHNLGLELWLSAGVLGPVGFMLALVGAIWTSLPALLQNAGGREGWRGALALGIVGALAAGVAHGLVDSAYFQPDYALAFWWGVATLVALRRAPTRGVRGSG
ncbi:MAG TPA: O-antigen ligase family protein [Ktedonobacterales bacterium]